MNELENLYELERQRLAILSKEENAPEGDYLHPVFGRGEVGSSLMIIGEAPGKEEAASGIPFIGKAGKQLNECLSLAGIDRERVFVTNAVKYRPVKRKPSSVSNRTPSAKEITGSLLLLENEIRIVKPAVIATFGNSPLFALQKIGEKAVPNGTVGEMHGKPFAFGFADMQLILFPMYHPASVIYNRALITVLEEDTRALAKLTSSI